MTTIKATSEAIIYEQGNGFPAAGDYVSDGDYLYRVEAIHGQAQTGNHKGNYVYADVERVGWEACDEDDQHTALVEVVAS